MTKVIFENNATSTLAFDITISSTTLVIQTADAPLFPDTADGYFFITLEDRANDKLEICRVNTRTTASLSVDRAQDGTVAQAWPTGTPVSLRLTAAALERFVQDDTQVITGDGLSGGGDLSIDRTLSVDDTVARLASAQTFTGAKTFSGGASVTGGTLDVSVGASFSDGLTVSAGTLQVGGTATITVPDHSFPLAKLPTVAQNHVVGRVSSGSGDLEMLTPDNVMAVVNAASSDLSDARLSANVALLDADQTWTGDNTFGTVRVDGETPVFELRESDQGVDEKRWLFYPIDGRLTIAAVNDAGGASGKTIKIDRTGNQIDGMSWLAGGSTEAFITADGPSYFNGGSVGIGTASPARPLHIDTGGSNEGMRVASSGSFALYEATDSTSSVLFGAKDGGFDVRLSDAAGARYSILLNGDHQFYDPSGGLILSLTSAGNVEITGTVKFASAVPESVYLAESGGSTTVSIGNGYIFLWTSNGAHRGLFFCIGASANAIYNYNMTTTGSGSDLDLTMSGGIATITNNTAGGLNVRYLYMRP